MGAWLVVAAACCVGLCGCEGVRYRPGAMVFHKGYAGPGVDAWAGGGVAVYDQDADGVADKVTLNLERKAFGAGAVYLDDDRDGAFERHWIARPILQLNHREESTVRIPAFPLDPASPPSRGTMKRFRLIR